MHAEWGRIVDPFANDMPHTPCPGELTTVYRPVMEAVFRGQYGCQVDGMFFLSSAAAVALRRIGCGHLLDRHSALITRQIIRGDVEELVAVWIVRVALVERWTRR
jgi:hypothetical protein